MLLTRASNAAVRLTAPLRAIPDFVIIGAMKAGTTALYRYLSALPDVVPAASKETEYFSYRYDRGQLWYRSRFPLREHLRRRGAITGEASPGYLDHYLAPRRCGKVLPDVRLIALLRNPVERAYSHYAFERVRNKEPLASFAAALQEEERRLTNPTAEEATGRPPWRAFSYKTRGQYADQLERWIDVYGHDRILVIQSERLEASPAAVVAEAADWIGTQYAEPADGFPRHNVGTYDSKLDPVTRAALAAHFAPHNERLYQLLGYRFEWK